MWESEGWGRNDTIRWVSKVQTGFFSSLSELQISRYNMPDSSSLYVLLMNPKRLKQMNIKVLRGVRIKTWIRSERRIPSTVNQKIPFNPQHSSIGRKKKLFFPPETLRGRQRAGSQNSLPAGFTERFDRQLDGLFLLKDFTLLSRTLRSHRRIYRLCFPECMNVCMISVIPVKNGSRGDRLRVQRATGAHSPNFPLSHNFPLL